MKKKILGMIIGLLGVTQVASAFTGSSYKYDGVYVDATETNTVATDGTSPWTTTANDAGILWRARTGFANNSTIYTSGDTAPNDNNIEIYTTITGLAPGWKYDISTVYWSSNDGGGYFWGITAGFTSGNLTRYDATSASVTWTGASEGNRREFQANIGSAVADANGKIKVYIDDTGATNRTWYDGIVYRNGKPAFDPLPANNATEISASSPLVLSWMAGRNDAGTAIDPAIKKQYVVFSVDEPNFIASNSHLVTAVAGDRSTYTVGGLLENKTYYWRVDTVIGSSDTNFGDPNCLSGRVWKFETIKTLPLFDLQPVSITGDQDSVVTLTAHAIAANNPSTISYVWYKGTPGTGETQVGTGESLQLTLTSAVEGSYFCRATNNAGARDSSVVFVAPKRVMALFNFDNNLDNSAGGSAATMTTPAYSTDVAYTAASSASLSLSGSAAAAVDANLFKSANDITISVWYKYTTANNWQRVFDFGNGTGEYMFLTPSNGSNSIFAIKTAAGGEQTLTGSAIAINTWVNVVITIEGNVGTMYLNGVSVARNVNMSYNPKDIVYGATSCYIGDSQYASDPFFTGLIDRLEIRNYAISNVQVAEAYTAAKNVVVCMEAMSYDIAGPSGMGNKDCKVNIYDFAALAQNWLKCNLYPDSNCN